MDPFLELIKELNIPQLFVIDDVKKDLNEKIDRIETHIQRVEEKIEAVDRRLCHIEGSLQFHGNCLFNQARLEKLAQ